LPSRIFLRWAFQLQFKSFSPTIGDTSYEKRKTPQILKQLPRRKRRVVQISPWIDCSLVWGTSHPCHRRDHHAPIHEQGRASSRWNWRNCMLVMPVVPAASRPHRTCHLAQAWNAKKRALEAWQSLGRLNAHPPINHVVLPRPASRDGTQRPCAREGKAAGGLEGLGRKPGTRIFQGQTSNHIRAI
jgi:hypothetical protein